VKKIFVQKDVNDLRRTTKTTLENKYFNYFMDSVKFTGPERIASDYLMKQFWSVGTCSAFKIKHTNEVGFCPYTTQRFNMYDFPEVIQFVNKRNVPFIPEGEQVVGKSAAIGWIQANHKSIKMMVDYYISRMTEVEMVINTNLQVSKLPWLIGVTPADKDKAEDIIDRILNDEVVVFSDMQDLQMVQSFATTTPYIIDKLYSYKTSLENELLTFLGLDNSQTDKQLLVDQVNANNESINANQQSLLNHLEQFLDDINEVFGVNYSVEPTRKPVESVYDENNDISSPYQEVENDNQ